MNKKLKRYEVSIVAEVLATSEEEAIKFFERDNACGSFGRDSYEVEIIK